MSCTELVTEYEEKYRVTYLRKFINSLKLLDIKNHSNLSNIKCVLPNQAELARSELLTLVRERKENPKCFRKLFEKLFKKQFSTRKNVLCGESCSYTPSVAVLEHNLLQMSELGKGTFCFLSEHNIQQL